MSLVRFKDFSRPEVARRLLSAAEKKFQEAFGPGTQLKLLEDMDDMETYIKWMQEVEGEAFREDLRYSRNTWKERIAKKHALLFMLFKEDKPKEDAPIAFSFSFYDDDYDPDTHYADVTAVKTAYRQRGKRGSGFRGIGSITLDLTYVLRYLLGYRCSVLACEVEDEKGIRLLEYYKKRDYKVWDERSSAGCCYLYRDITAGEAKDILEKYGIDV